MSNEPTTPQRTGSTFPPPVPPEILLSAAARLRAEYEGAESPETRVILQHETGVTLERAGDDAGAAREFLGAMSLEGEFREPLEAMIALLYRRRSFKNLGKLLDTLVRTAVSPDELGRAQYEKAAFLLDHEDNVEAAKDALLDATNDNPEELAAWLELEILAGKAKDDEGRRQALAERVSRAEPAPWRQLLYVDLAALENKEGNHEKALEALRAACSLDGANRFRAYVALAETGRIQNDLSLVADTLSLMAEMVEECISDASKAESNGVPSYARTTTYLADLLLRAADARRALGEAKQSAALLDKALELLPEDVSLLATRLLVSDSLGQKDKSAVLASKLIALGSQGPEAAGLWLRIWEQALIANETDAAFDAIAAAIKADPSSVAVRAAYEDALARRNADGDAAALAAFREAAAELVATDASKARALLDAAWHYAVGAKDPVGAKAALSQTGALGLEAPLVSRIGRTLATLHGDAAWQDDASRRVIASGACPESEMASAWLELVRMRWHRGDKEGAKKAIDSLLTVPGGAWPARVLLALSPLGASGGGEEPAVRPAAQTLDALAEAEPDRDVAKALRVAAAWRAKSLGDAEGAESRLRAMLENEPGDLVVMAFLSRLLLAKGDAAGAASVLSAGAAASEDSALAGALHIESSLMLWKAGDRAGALESLAMAQKVSPASAVALLLLATRAAQPEDPEARRRALELAAEAGEPADALALERLGLELWPGGDAAEALRALESLEQNSLGELALAAALARSLWHGAAEDRVAVDSALDRIESASKAGASIAHSERTRLSRDVDGNVTDYARSAAAWAAADPGIVSGLEWLGSAVASDDRGGEAAAYRLLAEQLQAPAKGALQAHSTTIRWLSGLDDSTAPIMSGEPAAQLLNLELAPSGCDPRRRAMALRSVGSSLGEAAAADAFALVGWSELAVGDAPAALEAFETAVKNSPDSVAAWEGVRASAMQLANHGKVALAAARLGELCMDPSRSAAFFEQAGFLWLDTIKDEARGEEAISLAFAQDPTRFASFDRLFRRVRQRGEDDALLEITARRLEVSDDPTELAKLHWEQARVLRKKGDYKAALAALELVREFEPDHVGALALSGEVYIKQGQFGEAAESLAKLVTHPDAPAQQRLISGIAAVDLYEKRLDQPQKALEILLQLHNGGLSNLPVRERLALVAAKTSSWDKATSVLEELMNERESSEGRIAAARLAMSIYRDKIKAPSKSTKAVSKLLSESPGDGEALDLVMATGFESAFKSGLLKSGRGAIVQQLQRDQLEPDAVARLAEIARVTEDRALTQAALGVLVSLGRDSSAVSTELASLDQRVAKTPQIQIDAQALAAIGDPLDTGAITRLFTELGPYIGEALGPTKETLGVGRKEKVDPGSGLPLRNDVAAWAGALGLGEFDLYIGGKDPNGVEGVAGEVPALVVGSNVTSPLTPTARQAIARELFALKRGILVVRKRDEATVASIAIATCNIAGVKLDAPAYAMLGEVQRQLTKPLSGGFFGSSAIKKKLPELCGDLARESPNLRAWAEAAQRSLDRVAAIAAGDVSLVLADVLKTPRGELKNQVSINERAQRLLRFVLSPTYLDLRNRLGMGVR